MIPSRRVSLWPRRGTDLASRRPRAVARSRPAPGRDPNDLIERLSRQRNGTPGSPPSTRSGWPSWPLALRGGHDDQHRRGRASGAVDGLSMAHGRLQLANRAAAERLRKSLAPALAGRGAPAEQPPIRLARSGGQADYLLRVHPVPRPARNGAHGPVAIVTARDPERAVDPDLDLLRARYGLTPAEAAISALIGGGLSLREIADKRGVSLETVRSHLKRTLAKTGARRQLDLLRLILAAGGGR